VGDGDQNGHAGAYVSAANDIMKVDPHLPIVQPRMPLITASTHASITHASITQASVTHALVTHASGTNASCTHASGTHTEARALMPSRMC